MSGAAAIAIARTWVGTPFQTGASVQGVGADCVGLIEGIAQQVGVTCPRRDAFEQDLLRAAASVLMPVEQAQAGCIILLSAHPSGPPLHAALVTDTDTLIHAHWRAGVVENRFGNWFRTRVTHIFAWPETGTHKDD
jgi:NlpC/P60 family putative phage cell wall peptidase